MKVALIGASGNVGSRILAELVSRGIEVTAIARHLEKIAASTGVIPVKGDLFDRAAMAQLLRGHDAVISSVPFGGSDPGILIGAVLDSGVKRYLVVGGAGSLEVQPGVMLLNTANFPAAYRPEAEKGLVFLQKLQSEKDFDWTFLSPSAEFGPGARTGKFRLGANQLLIKDQKSSISYEDFAIALIDELETPTHPCQRFTVGY